MSDTEISTQCKHEALRLVPPCCTQRGSSGYIECGCGGYTDIVCDDCGETLDGSDYVRAMEQINGGEL